MDKKILYVNISAIDCYRGHRQFDVEWSEMLSQIGNVDLIQPEPGWFEGYSDSINVITFEPGKHVKLRWLWKSKLLNLGKLKGVAPYKHAQTHAILKYVKKLDKANNYDIILAAHFDLIALSLNHIKKSLLDKTFVLEHLPPQYDKAVWKRLFNKMKNKVNHIAMEKPGIKHLIEDNGINEEKVFYIPHPFNNVIDNIVNTESYDVLGISNSNDPEYVKDIIEYEEKTRFFASNKVKVFIRNKEHEYDDGFLQVVKGHLNYTYDEFYSLTANAKILLILFPLSFGARTSGTIIDALSYRVKSIGTPFETFLSYCDDYPNACKSFNSVEDMAQLIVSELNNKSTKCEEDFDRFYEDRSTNNMVNYLNKLIQR